MDRSEDAEPKGREAALFQVRDGGKPRVAQPPQRDSAKRGGVVDPAMRPARSVTGRSA